MQSSGSPSKFQLPWANNAGSSYIRTIPITSQIGILNGAASLADGFPPLNFLPVGSGGVPPFGQDMNGILNQTTANLQWLNAGGMFAYDSVFSTAVGGYPAGCMLKSASTVGLFWLNTVDNNTTNPESGGSNWTPFSNIHGFQSFTSSGTFTVPAGVYLLIIEAWGAGGGGGGSLSTTDSGSGGGGGGYGIKRLAVTPGQVITFTIGAGGTGGTSGGGTGGTGGSTNIAGVIGVAGGAGGPGGSTPIGSRTPGAGGAVPTADFGIGGGPGFGFIQTSGFVAGGGGGDSPRGGAGGIGNNGAAGATGVFPGGGGGAAGAGSGAQAGGAGAGGAIIFNY